MWRKYTSVLTCCSLWIFQYFLLACANYIYWRSGSARTFCSTFLGDDLDEFSHAPCLCLCHWQDFHVIHIVQSNCYWLPCKSDVISPDVGDVDLVLCLTCGRRGGSPTRRVRRQRILWWREMTNCPSPGWGTRRRPELILTVSHQTFLWERGQADQEVVMSTLRLLIFTELSADWACSEKAGRDFSHNEWVFLRIFCPSSRDLYTVRKASKIIFQTVGFS